MNQVNRGPVRLDEFLDFLLQHRRAVFVHERNRALFRFHEHGRKSVQLREPLFEKARVTEGRGHEKKPCLRQSEQRNLPGDAPLMIGVVVKLVHDDLVDLRPITFAERKVREDLRGAANHRRPRVDRRIPCDHPDILRPENLTERQELLIRERLHRHSVEGAASQTDRTILERLRDEGFPRSRRSIQNHIVPREELEDCFLLMIVGFDSVFDEMTEKGVENFIV